MGCGSSSNVTPVAEDVSTKEKTASATSKLNGKATDVVSPESVGEKKQPLAFEIPINDDSPSNTVNKPPPRLRKLSKHSTVSNITLPEIEDKLKDAEVRRNKILKQRSESALKRAQKIQLIEEMKKLEKELDKIENGEVKRKFTFYDAVNEIREYNRNLLKDNKNPFAIL